MATLTTRELTQTDGTAGKGLPLTNAEVDQNFINLNDDQTLTFKAKNDEGAELVKGDPVYIKGLSGNTPTVAKADSTDANKMPVFGLVQLNANDSASVTLVIFGDLTGLNTSTLTAGNSVYVSNGGLSSTPPTGEGSLLQNIGICQRSDVTVGSVKVAGAGRTNATPNLDSGKLFLGDSNNQAVSTALSGGATVDENGVVTLIDSNWDDAHTHSLSTHAPIDANNYAHPATHSISEVAELQTALDAKEALGNAVAMSIALG